MILILTFAIFLSYLTITTVKYGWLPSISESFYRLPTRLNWIFSIFLWTISVLLIWATWDTTLIVLAGFCIMGVGVFPYFREERWMHYVFALTGIGLGIVSLWVDFNNHYLPIGFGIIAAVIYNSDLKNKFWWIEVLAFLTIIVVLIIK